MVQAHQCDVDRPPDAEWRGKQSRYGGVQANEKLEAGYAIPPTAPLVSGSSASLIPYSDLGQQGRRFVTDVVTQN
jgi:uncharacterized membrane protein